MPRLRDPGNSYTHILRTAWLQAAHTLANPEHAMAAHGHFHWNELLTPDVERAKQFYADTIGWQFEPMPMEDLTVPVRRAPASVTPRCSGQSMASASCW